MNRREDGDSVTNNKNRFPMLKRGFRKQPRERDGVSATYNKKNASQHCRDAFGLYPFTDYLMRKENLLKFFRAMPVPRATARSGSSAMWTFSLVLLAMR